MSILPRIARRFLSQFNRTMHTNAAKTTIIILRKNIGPYGQSTAYVTPTRDDHEKHYDATTGKQISTVTVREEGKLHYLSPEQLASIEQALKLSDNKIHHVSPMQLIAIKDALDKQDKNAY